MHRAFKIILIVIAYDRRTAMLPMKDIIDRQTHLTCLQQRVTVADTARVWRRIGI